MPTAGQLKRAATAVEELRKKHHGEIVIDAVVPDYHARLPKPCVGGWGRRSLNVTPSGKVLPCHAAESIPGWPVRQLRSAIRHQGWGCSWLSRPCLALEHRRFGNSSTSI
jgi:PqqA peptide cyclase